MSTHSSSDEHSEKDSISEIDAVVQEESSNDHLRSLRAALENVKPPYYSGTLAVDESSLALFYGNARGQAGRIDMSKASEEELISLSKACDEATFGHNQEDVLDPSYRKALKLDPQYFSIKLDLASVGLLDAIRYGLLEGKQGARPFSAELYKLNVYGKDSFFKAHKDTPRGENMFGSLVIVFPTKHEGGALLLRHGEKEWTFDSGRFLAETRKPISPSDPNTSVRPEKRSRTDEDSNVAEQRSIAFVAFFSDVEHEVTPVKSGFRVTLTYNLYFETNPKTAVDRPLQVKEQPVPSAIDDLKAALSSLLDEPSFLPDGGTIGFGLYHQYPIDKDSGSIKGLHKRLKGRDAMIREACIDLALKADLWLLYDAEPDESQILAKEPVDIGSTMYGSNFVDTAAEYYGSSSDLRFLDSEENMKLNEDESSKILWVNKLSALNKIPTRYAYYGNESYLTCTYANVCLIVDIGPAGNRGKKSKT